MPNGTDSIPFFYIATWVAYAISLLGVFIFIFTNTRAHYLLILVILIKLVINFIATYYWVLYQKYGLRNSTLIGMRTRSVPFVEAFFICYVFLLSKGYCVTRKSLSRTVLRSFLLSILILVAIMTILGVKVQGFANLCLPIVYVFLLPQIYAASSRLLELSSGRYQLAVDGGLELQQTVLLNKKNYFSFMRLYSLLMTSLVLILVVTQTAGYWIPEWISVFLYEFTMLGFVIALIFRLRPITGLFVNSPDHHAAELINVLHRAVAQRSNVPPVEHWDLSSTLIVEWPHESNSSTRDSLNNSSTKGISHVSMLVKESYDISQKLELELASSRKDKKSGLEED